MYKIETFCHSCSLLSGNPVLLMSALSSIRPNGFTNELSNGNLQVFIVLSKCIMEGYPICTYSGSHSATVCMYTLSVMETSLIQWHWGGHGNDNTRLIIAQFR